jgi:hypothetical protein
MFSIGLREPSRGRLFFFETNFWVVRIWYIEYSGRYVMTEKNFVCKECGHTKSKVGKIGNSGYDMVKPPGFNAFKMGTSLLITCCAQCGEVSSMRIENPNAL